MEEGRPLKTLTDTPTGKRPLGRPRHRWEDNRMDLKEIGINKRNWFNYWDYWRVVNAVLNVQVS